MSHSVCFSQITHSSQYLIIILVNSIKKYYHTNVISNSRLGHIDDRYSFQWSFLKQVKINKFWFASQNFLTHKSNQQLTSPKRPSTPGCPAWLTPPLPPHFPATTILNSTHIFWWTRPPGYIEKFPNQQFSNRLCSTLFFGRADWHQNPPAAPSIRTIHWSGAVWAPWAWDA